MCSAIELILQNQKKKDYNFGEDSKRAMESNNPTAVKMDK